MPWELLAACSSLGLSELQAYELIDGPIGLQRGDQRAHAIALAACGGKPSAVMELLEFGTPEEQEHTLIELPPDEKAAHAAALLGKFEVIVGGPPDGHSR